MEISSVYADPERTTRNAALLAKRAGVPVAAARAFLKDQAASQVRRCTSKPSAAAFAPTGDLPGTYAADVIFLADYAGLMQLEPAS